MALGCGMEKPLASVGRSGQALNEVLLDQFLEHPVQALLGNAQDVQEFGDGQARLPVDEMQHAVMGPPEPVFGEDAVRVAYEVAVGEKEEFYQVVGRQLGEHILARVPPRRG